MVKVTIEKDGKTKVYTGESVIGMTISKEELDDEKVTYTGDRFGMIDMDGEYLPKLIVEFIRDLFKEVHETPIDYLDAMVQTSELLTKTTESAIAENADVLADALKDILKADALQDILKGEKA